MLIARVSTTHISSQKTTRVGSKPRTSSFTSAPQHRRSIAPVCAGAVIDVEESTWEQEVLKSDLPVLIDFWATWCGPCKLVAPSMEWAQKEFNGKLKVVKVEADGNKSLIEGLKVYGLPCLVIFKDGEELEGSHREGAITRKDLVKYLEKHVGLTVAA
jgi:thioredoxin 1